MTKGESTATGTYIISRMRMSTCGHIYDTILPQVGLTPEGVERALDRSLSKPCQECKNG